MLFKSSVNGEGFDKLKNNPLFKTNPDEVIRNYVLPIDKLSRVEVLIPNYLALKVCRLPRTGNISKCYHYQKSGRLIKSLGNVDKITYAEACHKAKQEMVKLSQTIGAPKNTLADIFHMFCERNHSASPNTRKKWNKIFNSKLQDLCDKDIRKFTLSDFLPIIDKLYNDRKYAALRHFYSLTKRLFDLAIAREILNKNPLYQPLSNFYILPKSEGYSYIKDEEDLKTLISFCINYKHSLSVKNALIFGLLTGLRSANVRNITINHLQKDKTGEYHLHFLKNEVKVKNNGDEYLGLPKEIGDWLIKIASRNNGEKLLFPSNSGKTLSDATLTKAIRGYKPSEEQERLVFHSFRKVLSTFCHEEIVNNGLSDYEIERTIFHKQDIISGTYNKAANIAVTRKVLVWWLGYLKSLGLSL